MNGMSKYAASGVFPSLKIYLNGFGDLNVAWDIVYDQEDGSMVGYYCGDYIDENNFDYNGCRFTRSATGS